MEGLMSGRHDLSDREWAVIAPLLPNKPRGVARVDDRRVISGIFYILRTGAPWRDLPDRYGPPTTVYNRYNRWAKQGVWLCIFERLSQVSPDSLRSEEHTSELQSRENIVCRLLLEK